MEKGETAAEAIVRLVGENPGEVSLLCVAPLTNIALALALDPSLPSKVKSIFVMGGTLYGKGSWKGGVEFNFGADPEAAHMVLKSFPLIHMIPCEAARELVLD